ncbi:MAG: glycosyltransferase [Vicinamibacterales bacterium]
MLRPSTALAPSYAADGPAVRLLVLRTCRPAEWEQGLTAFQSELLPSELTVVSAGPRPSADADARRATITVRGSRFGLRSLTAIDLLRASRRATHVGVPQMWSAPSAYVNVYSLALLLAPNILLWSPQAGLVRHTRWSLLRVVLGHLWAHYFDVPRFLALAAAAVLWPRRRQPREDGPLRVLAVITSWGVGGAQRQLAELARGLPPGRASLDIFVLARADGDFSSRHLAGHPVSIRYATDWTSLVHTVLELRALCRREDYDVVHTWLFYANVIGVTAARLAGTPRVLASVRNLSTWKRQWATRWWFRTADALSSWASDRVTVNAAPLVADHARWAFVPRRRITVVPNGLTAPDLVPGRDERAALRRRLGLSVDCPVLGTVGRLAEEKDHATLLGAWKRVLRRHPGATLVIKGDGPLAARLRAQAATIDGRVIFDTDPADPLPFIAGLDVFVLPSRIEGFANVLLEAALIGVPVVATDVGAAREIVGAAGDLVPVRDALRLAERIEAVLSDLPTARTRAAARCRRVRQDFTTDRMVENWLSLYHGAHA